MTSNKKILGLITARGGSKGIPGKNIKPLLGKPLIAWTIEAAKEAAVFDRIILSTDDEDIAGIARELGCEVPFMRPPELATDTAGHLGVIAHALAWLRDHERYEPEYTMLMQPTSPTRRAYHIKEAVALAHAHPEADSVLSVARVPDSYNSQKTMIIDNGSLRLINGAPIYKRVARRQDLRFEFYSTGMLYLFKSKLLEQPDPNFYGERTLPYEVDPKYTIDIDEPSDWPIAEAKMKELGSVTA